MSADPLLLSWPQRILFGAMAFAGTALYALSFRWLETPDLVPIAFWVGVASGVSWPCFGAILGALTRFRPTIWHWADACLWTMGIGIVVLNLSSVLNGILFATGRTDALQSGLGGKLHALILLAADGVMCALFVTRAQKLGMSFGGALAAWWLGLNGVFAAILIAVAARGGFAA